MGFAGSSPPRMMFYVRICCSLVQAFPPSPQVGLCAEMWAACGVQIFSKTQMMWTLVINTKNMQEHMILMGQFQRFWFYSNGIVTQLIYTAQPRNPVVHRHFPHWNWSCIFFLATVSPVFRHSQNILHIYNHI